MMERIQRKKLWVLFAFLIQTLLPATLCQAELRKVKIGERMPEFSLPNSNGTIVSYKHNHNKVLLLVFLPTSQRRIERAIKDIETVIENLQENKGQFDSIGVISGPPAKDFSESLNRKLKFSFPILLDGDFQLWGKLGVIAAPTIIIVGKDDNIQWIKAGYGYDFEPVVCAHLKQALGIVQEEAVKEAQQVKTVTNDTVAARIQRHLQMAKILEEKGRIQAAINELQKAAELDPNSNTSIFELGELLCRAGRNKEALNVAEKIKATNRFDKARRLMISGWARRQLNELDAAEKDLLEATKLDPTSVRALFELGKIQQVRGQTEKAMKSYYTALALVFNESEKKKIFFDEKK